MWKNLADLSKILNPVSLGAATIVGEAVTAGTKLVKSAASAVLYTDIVINPGDPTYAQISAFVRKQESITFDKKLILSGDLSGIGLEAAGTSLFRYRGVLAYFSSATDDAHRYDSDDGDSKKHAVRATSLLRLFTRDERLVASILADMDCSDGTNALRAYETKWDGSWVPIPFLSRPIDSVFLPQGQLEGLIAIVRKFRESRAQYESRGIPHRISFLFSGPPGVGKSSLAQALACEFATAIRYLRPEVLGTEARLIKATKYFGEGDFVILEDLDSYLQQDAGGLISKDYRGAIMAMLDGANAQPGQIYITTTNHKHKLDSIMLRPGRTDHIIEFGPVCRSQALAMYRYYGQPNNTADQFAWEVVEGDYVVAELEAHLLGVTLHDRPLFPLPPPMVMKQYLAEENEGLPKH